VAELQDDQRAVGVIDADPLTAFVGITHHPPCANSGRLVVAAPGVAEHLGGGGPAHQPAGSRERCERVDLGDV
jgi:hypothetical protein